MLLHCLPCTGTIPPFPAGSSRSPRARASSPTSSASACARSRSTGATGRSTKSACAARRASARAGASRTRNASPSSPGADEASVREAVRALRSAAGKEPLPIRASKGAAGDDAGGLRRGRSLDPAADRGPRPPRSAAPVPLAVARDRATRRRLRLGLPRGRLAPPPRLARGPLHGGVAARRRGAVDRVPRPGRRRDAGRAARAADRGGRAARPAGRGRRRRDRRRARRRDRAAVLFHEILGHALEADAAASPLSRSEGRPRRRRGARRPRRRAAPRSLRRLRAGRRGHGAPSRQAPPLRPPGLAADRPGARARRRLERPRASRRAGRGADAPLLERRRAGRLRDLRGDRAPGQRRDLDRGVQGGSVELSGGTFRLRFPRARRLRRGRFTEELGPGILAGEILPALKNVEPVLGREARPCRSLGWCSRDGQVVPVQGEAPDVLIRRLAVRPAL